MNLRKAKSSNVMQQQSHLDRDDVVGDFDALLRVLEQPADAVVVNGGYANLMARIGSTDYRRRCAGEHR